MVTIEETFPGERWWIAAIVNREHHANLPPIERIKMETRDKDGFTSTYMHRTLGKIGTLRLTGDDTNTTLQVTTPEEYAGSWQGLIAAIQEIAQHAHTLRRLASNMTPEGAIEYYYRVRASGKKITLREVAMRIGLSEQHLRNVKVDYDRAGKWGSKSNKKRPK